jgi:hypothetical protein
MNQKICHIQSVHSDTDNFYLTVNGQSYRLPWTNCSAPRTLWSAIRIIAPLTLSTIE